VIEVMAGHWGRESGNTRLVGERPGAHAVTSVMQTLSPIGRDEDRSVSASP